MELGPRELAQEWKLGELVGERWSRRVVEEEERWSRRAVEEEERWSKLVAVVRWSKLGVAGERSNKLEVVEERWSTPEASTRVRVARGSSSGKASLVEVVVVE
jgi:hypothetical protein